MMHKISIWGAGAIVGLLALGAPFAAGALTIQDLQNQIASLLQQIAQMQGTQGASTTSAPAQQQYRICGILNRNLTMGAQGDDVSALQEFLQGQGYLSVQPTGYFGSLTAGAVAKWQTSQGVSSVGAFGPMSRSRLITWCGGGTNSNFSATPNAGQAPLAVTFTTGVSLADTATYAVDFGDGTSGDMTKGSCIGITAVVGGQGGIRCSYTATHTYTSNGTYAAKLMKNTCPAGAQCFAGPLPVATATVTVGDATSGNIQRINTPANVTLSQSGIAEVRNQNFYFTLASLGSQTATVQITPVGCWNSFPSDPTPGIRCMIAIMPIAPVTLSVGQTYTSTNYTITLTSVTNSSATFSVAGASTSGNNPPVISGFSGPTTLSVGQTGTWTINASDPENGSLSYSITWGDENSFAPMSAAISASSAFVQNTTFTHAYSSAGTFTITITVHDSSGQSAQTTTTVQVGGTSSSGLSASPTSGQAPLQVAFTGTEDKAGDTVDFGDGTSDTMTTVISTCPLGGAVSSCGPHSVVWHTYTSAGTYTATLAQSGLPLCYGCKAPVLGTVTITVGGPNICQMIMVDCIVGYHSVQSTQFDANGCRLAPSCVPDTTLTCPTGQHICGCATGNYCLNAGAMCISPTSACPTQ